ncbi:MAG: hypothetical protein J7L22_08190, partial [Candidatus Marinimicrobia bacterium]|nr:hypothetical protein [Candidatus Neomarinimicrobiota bacterium]
HRQKADQKNRGLQFFPVHQNSIQRVGKVTTNERHFRKKVAQRATIQMTIIRKSCQCRKMVWRDVRVVTFTFYSDYGSAVDEISYFPSLIIELNLRNDYTLTAW